MSSVLVIGATGRTGRHVVDGLLEHGADVRALVRHPLTAALPDAVTVIEGALDDREALAAAAAGTDAAFLLWPTFDNALVDAVIGILAEHVAHIVYLSAARLQGDADGPMEGIYTAVEGAIRASGATWTFVRGGGFAANTLEWAAQVRAGDVVRTPFPDAARPLVHERDLAEVAVRALVDRELAGKAFAVTGDRALTQHEQIAAIGEALGRELRVETQPLAEARAEYTARMGADFAESALKHWATLTAEPEQRRDGVPQVLGRPARPFSEWARDHIEDFAQHTAASVARAYADALGAGDLASAGRWLADDVVRVAPVEGGEPVHGLAAIAENAAQQNAGVRIDNVEVSEPLTGGDQFALRFTFAETVEATGVPRTTTKLSLCTVSDSRIVREEIFYFDKPDRQ